MRQGACKNFASGRLQLLLVTHRNTSTCARNSYWEPVGRRSGDIRERVPFNSRAATAEKKGK